MKGLKAFLKFTLAGIVAVVILSIVLCFYNLTPVHHDNPKGNTDYVWPSNAVWVKLTEGIACGRYDAEGFNNPKVIDNPDIIIVGSSHMEASEVFYNQTVCALLNDKFDGKYSVYNFGISGHNFAKICQYLPVNLSIHDIAPKVAVMETSTVSITNETVDSILHREVERTHSYSTGLIGTLQKIPFFRNLYHQLKGGLIDLFMPGKSIDAVKPSSSVEGEDIKKIPSETVDIGAYKRIFEYLSSLEKQYGTQIVIFYHPTEKLNVDGSIEFESSETLNTFSSTADKYGISFIDMTDSFVKMYNESHQVAHGFVTGELCSGHLNANGHKAVADELYQKICDLEKEGLLCK